MAITGTGQFTQSLIEVLSADFQATLPRNYIYSQSPITVVPAGGSNDQSSLRIVSYHRLLPANTTRSEVTDISPVQLRDSALTITRALYGNAVQLSLKVQADASMDVFSRAAEFVAENAAESVDYVARSVAIAANAVEYGIGSTRIDVTNVGVLTPGLLYNAAGFLASAPKLDGGFNNVEIGQGLAAVMRNAVVADLAENSTIILLGQYRDNAPETVLMGEVGQHVSGVRLVVSNNAKIFQGAGALVNVSSAEPLANAIVAGGTSMTLSSGLTSGARGYAALGTIESPGNGEQTNVENIYIESSATGSTIAGGAPNGGIIFDHSSDTAVTPAHQVHAVVIFGAESLYKVHGSESLINVFSNFFFLLLTGCI